MKKETVILYIVIAFLVGFIAGATVAILKGTSGGGKPAIVQKPQPVPQGDLPPSGPGPSPTELNLKIKTLQDIVKKDPKNLSAWVELGNLHFDAGQPKEAIEAYNQYLAVKPDNADVRTDLGIMYRASGNFDRAIEEFKKAAQTDPKHMNSRYNMGIVLLHDKQDVKGAIKAWEEYLKVDTNSERANRIRSQIDKMKQMAEKIPPTKPPTAK